MDSNAICVHATDARMSHGAGASASPHGSVTSMTRADATRQDLLHVRQLGQAARAVPDHVDDDHVVGDVIDDPMTLYEHLVVLAAHIAWNDPTHVWEQLKAPRGLCLALGKEPPSAWRVFAEVSADRAQVR